MNDIYGTRSLREITRILFQHWFMMLVILLLGGVGTYVFCDWFAPRTYRSQISLIFKRPSNKNPVVSDTVGERSLEVFVKAQQQIVMSDLVLARAKVIADDPTLRKAWYDLRAQWNAAREEPNGRFAAAQSRVTDFLSKGSVADKVQRLLTTNQREFNDFRKSVKLETPGGEQVAMTESFTLNVDQPGERGVPDSHKRAAYAADVLADMYMVRFQEIQGQLNDPAVTIMRNVVREFEEEVARRQTAYQSFVEKNKDDISGLEQLLKSGTEQGYQIYLTELRKTNAALALAQAKDRAEHDVITKTVPSQAQKEGGIDGLSDAEVLSAIQSIAIDFVKENVAYVELAKHAVALAGKLAKAESQYREESRDLQYLRSQVSQTRRQLLAAIVAHGKGLKARIAAREKELAENKALLDQTAGSQNRIHVKLADYVRLRNDYDVAQKHLEKLEQDLIDAMTNQARARESVTISKLDEASIPAVDKPVVPLTGLYTAVAVAVSILLGLAWAFLADHFDHSVRSTVDAERYLGLPVLGSVKKRGRGLLVPA